MILAKYNEIMSRVYVTPEMRERVLSEIAEHRQSKDNVKISYYEYKRIIRWIPAVAVACLAVTVGLYFNQINAPVGTEDAVMVGGSGIKEYSGIAELEAAVGFDMPEIEDVPFDVSQITYSDFSGVAELAYISESGEKLSVLKAIDNGTDISGDYNEYSVEKKIEINGITVIVKGNNGLLNLAMWTDNGYAYALSSSNGMAEDTFLELLNQVVN